MTIREVAIVGAVALVLAVIAVPRFLARSRQAGEPVLAKNLHLVEQAKEAFTMERSLRLGTPVELAQLVSAGYLREVPATPPGLVIHPGKVGEAVHLEERGTL